jgi:hypothetical protein
LQGRRLAAIWIVPLTAGESQPNWLPRQVRAFFAEHAGERARI